MLHAQTAWVTITGTITDSSGGAVPGAVIRAKLSQTNEVSETRSERTGRFSLSFLLPGNYRLDVSAKGFQSLRENNIVLHSSDAIDLPLRMEVNRVSEKVEVSGDPGTVDTISASRSQTINQAKVKSLPLLGRQAYNLISLTPGVLFTQEQFGSNGFTGLRSWDNNGKYIINGGLEGTNQFLLNGAPVSLTGRWQISPSVEAVQEVRVMVNTYDAQFGRTGGGTVNTTLRAGGNEWHGADYYFFHNAYLDANAFDKNLVGEPRGKHITNQFGGVAGGPLRKEKDFLFFSIEGYREIAPLPVVSDTPPLDLRDGSHFTNYGIHVYDPMTTRRCRVGIDTPIGQACFGTYIRSPFPNNTIPASRMSPIGKAVLGLYPSPNASGLTQNYIAGGNTGNYKYVQPVARYDHSFNDKDRFYAVFTFQHGTDIENSTGFPGAAALGSGTTERQDQNYIAEWTHISSASRVWDVRASFGRFTEFFPQNNCSTCITPKQLGITQLPKPPGYTGTLAPQFDVDQYSSIIGGTYSWNTENQIDLAPSLILIKGRHVLHLGGEFAFTAVGNGGPGRANGNFSFTHQWTQEYAFRSRGPLDGNGVADLLLGLPYTGSVDFNDNFYRTAPYFAGYIQDAWKILPKLTLNLGLRYDVQVPYKDRYNRFDTGFAVDQQNPYSSAVLANWAILKAQYDATNPRYPYPDVPASLNGGILFGGGKYSRPYQTDFTDLQPRVGLAWNFMDKTVLRAGAGIFYQTPASYGSTYGFSQSASYVSSLDGGLTPSGSLSGPYSLDNPFPSGLLYPGRNLATNVGQTIAIDDRHRPLPRTYEYSFGFQRELPCKMLLEASYSGSITVHAPSPVDINSVSTADFNKGQADPFYLNRSLPDPFAGIFDPATALGSPTQIQAYNLLRPFPLFNGVTINNAPWARYRYDSLQTQLEKRVLDSSSSAGILSFVFSYTYSKSFEASHRLNPWNLAEPPIHELTATDKPQSIAFAGTWDLPLGWGRKFLPNIGPVAAAFVNGWAIDWIATYYSGVPVNKPDAIFTCGSYLAPVRQTSAHWFNNDPSCYQSRPLYTLRTTEDRFSNIRTPSAPQINLSVEKTFWLGERWLLQLRGEAYNLANTPIFGPPETDFRSPRFGQLPVQQSNFPRYVQIAAKIIF